MVYRFRGKDYTVVSSAGNRVAIEPIYNPDLETEYVNIDVFYSQAAPLSDQYEKKTECLTESAMNQKSIRIESELNQKSIRNQSEINQFSNAEKSEKNEKRHRVNPRSVEALVKARQFVAKDPYSVMCDNWPVLQWLDKKLGLETLEKAPTVPRRTAKEANAFFGLTKDQSHYRRLVSYYTDYKKSIQVPLAWYRFEIWFEKNIFIHLQD